MGLYNFQSRFVPFILDGRKTHTIRAMRVHSDKPGNILHLYTGLRQKGARLLMRVPCVKVEEIRIALDGVAGRGGNRKWEVHVWIDGERLDRDERELLARRDGFSNFEEMMTFWDGRIPFQGHIIHWRGHV